MKVLKTVSDRSNDPARVPRSAVSGSGRYRLVSEQGYDLREIPACIIVIGIYLHVEIRSEEAQEREKWLTNDLLRHLEITQMEVVGITLILTQTSINQ